LESTHPQLILMDIMMPDISGLEVSHRIKQKQNFRALPIILVSAIDRLQKQQLDYSKANDILYKPFNLDDLVSKVKEFMGASQFNSELIYA
ncbi:MAG: response regulator, partial [Cyanobacteria bacterium J06643_13]